MSRLLVTGVTFSVFMAEALIHYNMGRSKAEEEQFDFRLPPGEELARIVAVTATFSVVAGLIVGALARPRI